MNSRFLLVAFVSVIFLSSFSLPEKIKKKINKEIVDVFDIETYELKPVKVSEDLNSELPSKINGNNFFELISNDKHLGYVYVDQAPSKTAKFDYLVIFDADLVIKRSKVLIYREEYGGEIGSKRWLRQFEGKSKSDSLESVMAISGATISVNSMTNAVNDLLKTITILHQNKVI